MMTSKSNHAQGLATALRQAREQIDTAEREVEKLREKRQAIASAPVTRDEAKAAVSERVNAAAAAGRKRIADEAARFARGSGGEFDPRELLVRWVHAQDSWKPDTDILLALTARELEQHLRAAIDSDARYDGKHVMPQAEREKRLRELDREIEQAETKRDELVREFEAAGFDARALGLEVDEGGDTKPAGGDRGMAALIEQHERDRQATNAQLERAGVARPTDPKRIKAFEPVRRVSVAGEEE